MRRNPYEKYLSKEDRFQNFIMKYVKYQYPDVLCVHVPNEGRRSPFERFKLKYLGAVAGIPDVLIFQPNSEYSGLAIELKVGYNKPSKNQELILNKLKKANWAAYWSNSQDEVIEIIDKYLKK